MGRREHRPPGRRVLPPHARDPLKEIDHDVRTRRTALAAWDTAPHHYSAGALLALSRVRRRPVSGYLAQQSERCHPFKIAGDQATADIASVACIRNDDALRQP